MRILFLSRWFPYPTNNGAKLRVYHLLRGLATRHEVTLISFADELNRTPDPATVNDICADVHVAPWRDFAPESWAARAAFFSPTPRAVMSTHSPAMAAAVRDCMERRPYDLLIASQLATAAYVGHAKTIPALFDELESGVYWEQYAQAGSRAGRLRQGLMWHKYRRYVAHLLRNFAAVTVASTHEAELLTKLTAQPLRHEVIPNCVDVRAYADVTVPHRRNALIFTGPFRYHANHEAMVWFLDQVYPRIQAAVPDVTLTITGDHADLPLPPATNVTLTGQVPDVRPLVAGATCSIVPLRIGGGTRLKILESMALGTPVVSTHMGAEGLDARHDEHLLLADAPDAFAAAVVRALGDAALRRRLAVAGRALVHARYDWDAVMPRFLNLVDDVAMQRATVHNA
ncbi:MAG: glycosyltransferase [Caldilineaceae bacterium]|nr:glycosyltransferase [Caldilineaceae bacterium]